MRLARFDLRVLRGMALPWHVSRRLGLGSTVAALAPLYVPDESSYEQVNRVLYQIVKGFAAAEDRPEIPAD